MDINWNAHTETDQPCVNDVEFGSCPDPAAPVFYQVDPYQAEIHDDGTLVPLHDECAQTRRDDV